MTNDADLLARATRALRSTTGEPREDGTDGTLARLEATLAERRTPSRIRGRLLVVPIAAAFVFVGVWAAASGRLAALTSWRAHDDVERRTGSTAPPTGTSAAPSADMPRPLDIPARAAPSASAAPTETVPTPAPVRDGPRVRAPVAADADALYEEAHEAHFLAKDPARALALWDRYLAAAGGEARFLLEARYNRAVCLVRLGRRPEARAALLPFARGDYGSYRRDDATRLLGTVD